ncbi:hypothetical protein ACQR1Y_12435 [Bradyrhizobium sp. HKCCYLRH3099]
MQPIYVTLSSTGTTPWKLTNWQATPQELSFAVISTGGSSYSIAVTFEDPTATYPNPNSSAPTGFTIFTGSSNAAFELGSSVTLPIGNPIAAWQATLNTQSSAGAKVTFISMQSGIG